MTAVGMFEAKTHFSELVNDLLSGKTDRVCVSRRGNPVVQITLIQEDEPTIVLGKAKGRWKFPKHFDASFDAMDGEIAQDLLSGKAMP